MAGRRRSIITLHRKIEKDRQATLKANSPGGRYYRSTIGDKLAAARAAADRKETR